MQSHCALVSAGRRLSPLGRALNISLSRCAIADKLLYRRGCIAFYILVLGPEGQPYAVIVFVACMG